MPYGISQALKTRKEKRVESDRKVTETKTESRQGVTGTKARYVLIWGLGLSILAFIVLMALALSGKL
jgi:hypothetical protein